MDPSYWTLKGAAMLTMLNDWGRWGPGMRHLSTLPSFSGEVGKLGVGNMKIDIIWNWEVCCCFCLGRLGSWERTDETKTWIAIVWWIVNSFEVSTRCLGKMCNVTFEIPHQTIENCLRAGSCLQEVYWAGPKSSARCRLLACSGSVWCNNGQSLRFLCQEFQSPQKVKRPQRK